MSGSNGGHEFYVKSSSYTNVDFEYYFLIALPGRRRQPVEVPISNPVIGKGQLVKIYSYYSVSTAKQLLKNKTLGKEKRLLCLAIRLYFSRFA